MSSRPAAAALSFGSRTDVGCVREHNEDSLLVMCPLFAVADGMGGHAAGEVASEIAIRTLEEHAPLTIDSEALTQVVQDANQAILDAARDGEGRPGMGTTLTAAILKDTRLLIAQVGDSRAYLLHEGELQQITRDHSLVEELVALGEITEEEAAIHPNRSIITRALGSEEGTRPDIYEISVQPTDRLLLCSDGLSGMVCEDDLRTVLSTCKDPQKAADDLVAMARENGGFDNITAIVVDARTRTGKQQRRRKRRSIMGVLTFIVLLFALVGGAFGALYLYASNSAYLIAEDGYVCVYRGIPGEGIPGLEFKWLEYRTTVPVDKLAPTTAERLASGLQVGSMDEAEKLVDDYMRQIGE